MMNLDDFLAANGITAEIGPPMRYDQRGQAYVELTLGGVTDSSEPDRLITLASSEKLAITHYKAVLLAFLGGRKHIVWRIPPEIDSDDAGRWKVYSRLSAYDKPFPVRRGARFGA